MRLTPLIVIIVAVLVIGTSLGTTLLWIISVLSMIGVGVLIYFSVRQDRFVGPRVLLDDARDRLGFSDDDEDGSARTTDTRPKDRYND